MESFWLTWQFLLDHPAAATIAPVPWHLLAVLVVLGLLATGGLHHLLGHTYGFYKVPGGVAGWLAFPSFAVLLVSVQVLIAAYLIAALAPEMVRFSLASRAAQASAMPIGNLLLSPAFAGAGGGGLGEKSGEPAAGLNKAGLNRALHANTPKELRANFRRQLKQVRAEPISFTDAPDGDGQASPELFLLALQWAAEDHLDWPPQAQEGNPRAGEFEGAGGSAAAEGGASLSRSILSLVDEISWESDMTRRDWAHVAGNRFIQRVLGPLMVWQVRWLAVVTLILLLAGNLAVLFVLGQLKRLVLAPRDEQAGLAAGA